MNVSNNAVIGLNQGPEFQDLTCESGAQALDVGLYIETEGYFTAFLSAAGYASSSVLYNLGDPPFVHGNYTIGQFQVRTHAISLRVIISVSLFIDPHQRSEKWHRCGEYNRC